jgi:hypothetical protein
LFVWKQKYCYFRFVLISFVIWRYKRSSLSTTASSFFPPLLLLLLQSHLLFYVFNNNNVVVSIIFPFDKYAHIVHEVLPTGIMHFHSTIIRCKWERCYSNKCPSVCLVVRICLFSSFLSPLFFWWLYDFNDRDDKDDNVFVHTPFIDTMSVKTYMMLFNVVLISDTVKLVHSFLLIKKCPSFVDRHL